MTDIYRPGLRIMSPLWWEEGPPLGLLLLDAEGGSAFDLADLVVADLVGELSVPGYARQVPVASPPTWDAGSGTWTLAGAGVSFGHLGAGVPEDPTVGAVVLFGQGDDDESSQLLAYQAVSVQLDSTELFVPVPSGFAVVRQGAP